VFFFFFFCWLTTIPRLNTASRAKPLPQCHFIHLCERSPTSKCMLRVGSNLKVTENRKLSPEQRRTGHLQVHACRHLFSLITLRPVPESELVSLSPWNRRAGPRGVSARGCAPIQHASNYGLGSTNPHASAVHVEPFSSSAFKVLV